MGWGVLGQFLMLSSLKFSLRGSSAFYGIEKALSVEELCPFELFENTDFHTKWK